MEKNNELYDWVFRYNPYTKKWCATTRENYPKLFSKEGDDDILKSSSINTLVEVINKIGGDIENVNSILNK